VVRADGDEHAIALGREGIEPIDPLLVAALHQRLAQEVERVGLPVAGAIQRERALGGLADHLAVRLAHELAELLDAERVVGGRDGVAVGLRLEVDDLALLVLRAPLQLGVELLIEVVE
jgi:hypothetical protein